MVVMIMKLMLPVTMMMKMSGQSVLMAPAVTGRTLSTNGISSIPRLLV